MRERGEILLDIDSTDDPTHGHQQFGFFNGALTDVDRAIELLAFISGSAKCQ